jgi:cytochrome c-type biogenesis protein
LRHGYNRLYYNIIIGQGAGKVVNIHILCFIEGILTFISPCILPLFPVYVSYLAGTASGEENKASRVLNTAAFVLGFTIVFVLMGAAATTIGFFLREHINTFRKLSGVVMVLFGLFFLDMFRLPILDRTIKLEFTSVKKGVLPSVLFGMVFAFGWSPCTGPFLGTALMLAGSSGTVGTGVIALFLYSVGLGIPFILASLVFEKIRGATSWFTKHGRLIKCISGIILILTGVLVYTNHLKYTAGWTW